MKGSSLKECTQSRTLSQPWHGSFLEWSLPFEKTKVTAPQWSASCRSGPSPDADGHPGQDWKIGICAPIMVLLMVFHHYLECLIDWEQNRGTEVNWQVYANLLPNIIVGNKKSWLPRGKVEQGVRQEDNGVVAWQWQWLDALIMYLPNKHRQNCQCCPEGHIS